MYKEAEHKKYSSADKDRSDPRCKEASANFLQQIDPKFHLATPLADQPEMYKDFDFTIMYGSAPYTVETEQKLGWISTDGTFLVASYNNPKGRFYSTVDVSGRKWESKADIFIMLNGTFDALCMTKMPNVLNAPMSGKNTRVGTINEQFFNVPLKDFQFYYLESGTWQQA